MKQEWIEKTYDLVDEIKQSKTYKDLMKLKKEVEETKEIKQLVTAFQQANNKYIEVRKYGKYHPDLKLVQKTFQRAKEHLYKHPVVIQYISLEQKLQKELDLISKSIATSVSKKIKYPNDLGLIKRH